MEGNVIYLFLDSLESIVNSILHKYFTTVQKIILDELQTLASCNTMLHHCTCIMQDYWSAYETAQHQYDEHSTGGCNM